MVPGVIGVIGGSGIYQVDGLEGAEWRTVESPFGEASDAVCVGVLAGVEVAFLPRHGRGHRVPPNEVNYRANIDVLKRLGVTDIVSLSAVGSLREQLPPGTFVAVDQFIDRTIDRKKSFFGSGLVAHISMAHPVCARVSEALASSDAGVVRGGVYLAMEGPQFSSVAESKLYRQWGCDVIGMTNMPEAKLAREAEICYATLAMVTDFDCWHPEHGHVTVADVIAVLNQNGARARELVRQVVPRLAQLRAAGGCPHGCDHALDSAIMTAKAARAPEMLRRNEAIVRRFLAKESA
jgi:5'-methylthioadenosine phosphorylase